MSSPLLPIGIQSFEEIRTKGYLYVDKTPFICSLAEKGKYYFLSRPRRFGKSLFVDTIDCAFSGRQELFEGLYISSHEGRWDFLQKYSVLRVDFAGGTIRSPEDLSSRLHRIIDRFEIQYQTDKTEGSPGERLVYLIPQIAANSGSQVVILVDEYDKPILDNLKDTAVAIEMRELLKDFYSAIKPLDLYLRFVLLTGVSKFSKTGIFSGLNNLNDITLDAAYSAICGYTEQDLTLVFSEHLKGFNQDEVRDWYNGYSWLGDHVYNPFDILLLFSKGVYGPYWFESGTPSFLVTLLSKNPRSLPGLDNLIAGEELLGSYEPDDLKPETLLFQSGYLTIKGTRRIGMKQFYSVGFPNLEVKSAFSELMLGVLARAGDLSVNQINLSTVLDAGDTEGLRRVFHSFFSSIPHDWYRRNQLSGFEGYYASVVYAYFASLGYQVIPEDTTNKGQMDLTVKTPNGIWIFEFKVKGLGGSGVKSPLDQIQEMGYAEKYRGGSLPVYEIGVVFDPESRNIEQWEFGGRGE